MASRSLDDLVPELKEKAILLQKKALEAGINIIFTCTARSTNEQNALYSQGRNSLEITNDKRIVAGMPLITEEENKHKVTWTLVSKHLTDNEHPKARAFDIAVTINNKPVWDLKVNVNDNEIPDYEEVARIGASIGLIPGARFTNIYGQPRPDYPHFEI